MLLNQICDGEVTIDHPLDGHAQVIDIRHLGPVTVDGRKAANFRGQTIAPEDSLGRR